MRLLCILIFFSSAVYAQQVYWVSFTQKDTSFSLNNPQQFLSEKAIQRRQKFQIPITETDLPVSESYLSLLKAKGFVVLAKSKWLNGAAVVIPNRTDIDTLNKFSFVHKTISLGKYTPPQQVKKRIVQPNEFFKIQEAKQNPHKKNTDTSFYGKSFNQVSMLQTQRLHEQGFKGEGVDIAVIDAGFNNADTLPVFKQLRNEHRMKTTYDFVQQNKEVFEDDDHGLAVLSCMAGYLPNEFVGTAPMANYYLLRSENAQTEMPIEEVYWIAAIEYADSVGVDLVNSSLGYNEFDDITQNHTAKDLDGKTTMISKGAAMAVQKGMVVVVSAGNEGDDDWKFISVPADVEEVITVGGVDASRFFVGFSSIGPSNKRIKPDVMAQGDNVWVASTHGVFYQGDGTSYSSPIMAGSIACLMQAHPSTTPAQLMNVLHQSSSLYYHPDRFFGYGIPDMQLAYLLLQNDTTDAILDVKVLQDNQIHLAYRSFTPQKLEVKITNEMGVEILNETFVIKQNGTNRVALKKIKQFPKGKYSLQLVTEQGIKQFNFNNT